MVEKIKVPLPKKRDPIAKDLLTTGKYKLRIEKPKKGKGSFKRQPSIIEEEDV